MIVPWDLDWRDFVRVKLRERGFSSMLEYARLYEMSPYKVLARDLGNERLTPIQIQSFLHQETEGTSDFSYFMRSSLIRNLHAHVPNGFRSHDRWSLILALSSWAGSMGARWQAKCERIVQKIMRLDNLPDTWLPKAVNDPLLETLFSEEEL